MSNMRAKFVIKKVETFSKDSERVTFGAVYKNGYDQDGLDENNTYARFTPTAECTMTITNPALVGKFSVGNEYYVDFTPIYNEVDS